MWSSKQHAGRRLQPQAGSCSRRLSGMRPFLCFLACVSLVQGADIDPQPFLAAAQRLIDATSFLGTPFSDDEIITLKTAISQNDAEAVQKAQAVLDAHALFHVTITPEPRPEARCRGPSSWRSPKKWRNRGSLAKGLRWPRTSLLVKMCTTAGRAARAASA